MYMHQFNTWYVNVMCCKPAKDSEEDQDWVCGEGREKYGKQN